MCECKLATLKIVKASGIGALQWPMKKKKIHNIEVKVFVYLKLQPTWVENWISSIPLKLSFLAQGGPLVEAMCFSEAQVTPESDTAKFVLEAC